MSSQYVRTLAWMLVLGCTWVGAVSQAVAEEFKIALIQEARPEVEPWSAAFHDAAEALKQRDPSIKVTETFNAFDPTRAEPVIRQLLDEGYDVVVMASWVLNDVAMTLAAEYPDVPMVVTSFNVPQQPNLHIGTASYLQIGYATCWFLSKLSDDGRIGFVGSQPVPFDVETKKGCRIGAEAANPDGEVVEVYSNTFVDQQANREQVQALLDQDITEMFLASATADAVGGFRLCEQVGAHCATWAGDSRHFAPTAGVMSVMLDWTVLYDILIEQRKTGKGEAAVFDATFGNGGLVAQPFEGESAKDVSAALQEEFASMVKALANGEIDLPESEAHPGYP